MACIALGGAIGIAISLPDSWPVADRSLIVLVGVMLTGLLLALARPVVRADAHGVTVVNLVQRRRLEWAEVVGVGLGRDDPWASLDVADGTSVAMMALPSSEGERARRGVRELAALAAAHSGRHTR